VEEATAASDIDYPETKPNRFSQIMPLVSEQSEGKNKQGYLGESAGYIQASDRDEGEAPRLSFALAVKLRERLHGEGGGRKGRASGKSWKTTAEAAKKSTKDSTEARVTLKKR